MDFLIGIGVGMALVVLAVVVFRALRGDAATRFGPGKKVAFGVSVSRQPPETPAEGAVERKKSWSFGPLTTTTTVTVNRENWSLGPELVAALREGRTEEAASAIAAQQGTDIQSARRIAESAAQALKKAGT